MSDYDTAPVLEDVDFPTYVLFCASNLHLSRLRGQVCKIEELKDVWRIKPDMFYSEMLGKAYDKRIWLETLTPEQAALACEEDYQLKEKSRLYRQEKMSEDKEKYQAMYQKVREWRPNGEYKRLKNFMLNELAFSIARLDAFDDVPNVKLSTEEWKKQEMEKVLHDIRHYTQEHERELHEVHLNNVWLTGLRHSLNLPS